LDEELREAGGVAVAIVVCLCDIEAAVGTMGWLGAEGDQPKPCQCGSDVDEKQCVVLCVTG
jgi:hypothetical protein